MTDLDTDVVRFEYFGPVSGFPLLVDRDNCKTATNDAERRQIEADGYQAPSPGWPPLGWTTGFRPRNDLPGAISQWLDCQSKALCLMEQWQDAGYPVWNSNDVNGNKQDATDLVRDAYLVVKVLKKRGWRATVAEPRGRISFRDARIELDKLFDWVQAAGPLIGSGQRQDVSPAYLEVGRTDSASVSDTQPSVTVDPARTSPPTEEARARAGMKLSTQALEQILEGEMQAICGAANAIFRDLTKADNGIDGELEFRDNNGNASGRKVYVQLKCGDSHLRQRKEDRKLIFDVQNPRHLDYWQNQPCDVWLVIRNERGVIRWMNLTRYLRDRPNKECCQIEFDGSLLTASALLTLREDFIPKSNC